MPRRYRLSFHLARLLDRGYERLAWHLPKRLVYWAAIRLLVHATTGPYGTTHPARLRAMTALKRWTPPTPS